MELSYPISESVSGCNTFGKLYFLLEVIIGIPNNFVLQYKTNINVSMCSLKDMYLDVSSVAIYNCHKLKI